MFGDAGVRAIARVASVGTLDSLTELKLNANRITDGGLTEFATILVPSTARRAMPLLNELHLGGNMLGADGLRALGRLVHDGGLPRLRELWLYRQEALLTSEQVFRLSLGELGGVKLIRSAHSVNRNC
mmetsp:Transcript_6186/g.16235  ORF Transcript_6186/g.16235 Transcript_6186/m.16235 type:complete len:128 (-) Transcript_6186:224-607(-)